MPQLDRLFESMTQRGATQAVLLSDQPTQLFVGSQMTQGAPITGANLQAMLAEIVPFENSPQLLQDGQFEVYHPTANGTMKVNITRRGKILRAVIEPMPHGAAIPIAQAPTAQVSTIQAPTYPTQAPPPPPQSGTAPQVPYPGENPTVPSPYNGNVPPAPPSYLPPGTPMDGYPNSSGGGPMAPLPPEIQGKWNWGAFLCSWIWGIAHNTWIALLCFVPCVGWVMPFVLGAKGNEWAWRNKRFNSVQEFKKTQAIWGWVGLGINCFIFLPLFLILPAAILGPVFGRARVNAQRASSQSNLKQIGLATLQFSQDHNEQFPTGRTAAEWKGQLQKYLSSSRDLFTSPSTQEAYSLNPALGGVSMAAINDVANTPVFYESKADGLGGHNIEFMDGHVKWIRPSEWPTYRTYLDSQGAP